MLSHQNFGDTCHFAEILCHLGLEGTDYPSNRKVCTEPPPTDADTAKTLTANWNICSYQRTGPSGIRNTFFNQENLMPIDLTTDGPYVKVPAKQ